METHDHHIGAGFRRPDRVRQQRQVLGKREGADLRIGTGLHPPEGLRMDEVMGMDAHRGDAGRPFPRLVAGRIDGGEGEDRDSQALDIENGRPPRLDSVAARACGSNPLGPKTVQGIGESLVTGIDRMIVGAGHDVKAGGAQRLGVRKPGNQAEAAGGRHGSGVVGVNALAVAEKQVDALQHRADAVEGTMRVGTVQENVADGAEGPSKVTHRLT